MPTCPNTRGIRRHGTGWNPGQECPGIRYLLNSVVSCAGRTRNSVMRREKDYSPGGSGNSVHPEDKRSGCWLEETGIQHPTRRRAPAGKSGNQCTIESAKHESDIFFLSGIPLLRPYVSGVFNFLICGFTFLLGPIVCVSDDVSVFENKVISLGLTASGGSLVRFLHYHYGFGAVQLAVYRDGGSWSRMGSR